MKRNPFQGAARTWLFELGSANFVCTGLVMALFACLFSLLKQEQDDYFAMMYGLAIVSIYSGVAWQLLRLRAVEWQSLSPDFVKHYQLQCVLIYLLTALVGLGMAAVFLDFQTITSLLLSMIIGNVYILLCIHKPSYFQTAAIAFILNIFCYSVAELMPLSVVIIGLLVSTGFVIGQNYRIRFSSDALNTVADGMRASGWMVNFKFSFKWLTAFERQLFPMNYFIGPTLSSQLMLGAIIGMVYSGLSLYFAWELPLLFILLIFGLIISSMIHWGRLQKPQVFELLITLPVTNGVEDLRRKLSLAHRKIVLWLSGFTALMVLLHSVFGDIPLSLVLHSFLVCYGSILLAIALSSLANKIWQLSLIMFPVMLLSGWALYGHETLKDTPTAMMPFVVNIILIIIAEIMFRWSQTRLKLNRG